MIRAISSIDFSRPFHGLLTTDTTVPSSELLGYFRPSAARTKATE